MVLSAANQIGAPQDKHSHLVGIKYPNTPGTVYSFFSNGYKSLNTLVFTASNYTVGKGKAKCSEARVVDCRPLTEDDRMVLQHRAILTPSEVAHINTHGCLPIETPVGKLKWPKFVVWDEASDESTSRFARRYLLDFETFHKDPPHTIAAMLDAKKQIDGRMICSPKELGLPYGEQLKNYQLGFYSQLLNNIPKEPKTMIKITRPTLLNGRNIETYTNDEIVSLIARAENEIKSLNTLEHKPQRIKDAIKELTDGLRDLMEAFDGKDNG